MNTGLKKKKNSELIHLLRFKEAYGFFPEGEITPSENPDFTIMLDDGMLGIEHTQIFYEEKDGIIPQEQENIIRKIIERAQKEYINKDGTPLIISVFFNSLDKLNNKHIYSLPSILVDLVIKNKWKGSIEYDDGLPDEIGLIHIHHIKDLNFVEWNNPMSGWIDQMTDDKIENVIKGKGLKIERYRKKSNYLWLLIVADGFNSSSLFSYKGMFKNKIYETDFDKVFIFESFSKIYFELKLKKKKRILRLLRNWYRSFKVACLATSQLLTEQSQTVYRYHKSSQ